MASQLDGLGSAEGSVALSACLDEAIGAGTQLLVCSLLAPTCPSVHIDESEVETQSRKFAEKIHDVRLAAIGTLGRARPLLASELETRGIDSSPLFELGLLTSYEDHRDADRMAAVFERIWVSLQRLAALTRGTTEAPNRAPAPPKPMTKLQRQAWDLLDGEVLIGPELAQAVYGSPSREDAIRQLITRIRRAGYSIKNEGTGYFRPDALPAPDECSDRSRS